MTDKPRIETGPLMIGDDWPGLYLRGKHAKQYETAVRHAIVLLENLDNARSAEIKSPFLVAVLQGLASDLASCQLPMADQSKLQKIWRGDPPKELESPGPSDEIARQEPKE